MDVSGLIFVVGGGILLVVIVGILLWVISSNSGKRPDGDR
jgi:hypothetical protein